MSELPPPMSAQEIAAAGEAQQELPLLKHLGDWEAAAAKCLAPPLDLGFGGGGSAHRMAVTQLIAQPKVKGEQRSGVKSAREQVRAMGDDEVAERASKRAREIGEAASMPLSSPPRLSSLRNSPRPAPPHAHLARASAACPRTSARLTDSRIVASRSPHALMTSQAKWRRTASKRF